MVQQIVFLPCDQQLFRTKKTFEILDVHNVKIFARFRRSDALECMEVFLVEYTCFNLNLEIFTKTRSNRQLRFISTLGY
jgi:hypothetical protein